MKSKHILILTLFLTLFSCYSLHLNKANESFQAGEYTKAGETYRKIYSRTDVRKKVLRGEVAFRMGECYRLTNRNLQAISAYQKALRSGYPDKSVLFHLGYLHHREGKYPEAGKYYRDYLNQDSIDYLVTNGLAGILLADSLSANPTRYQIRKCNELNSARSDWGVMITPSGDQLYLTSTGSKDKNLSINPVTGQKPNRLFISKRRDLDKWEAPVLLEVNVPDEWEMGTPAFTPDKRYLYLTVSRPIPPAGAAIQIFRTTKTETGWQEPEPVYLFRDSSILTAHPAVSTDSKYLYFISDKAGGYGNKDIYRCRIILDSFGIPENLGGSINTPGDEWFPYLRDDNTLYFASNGHPGMGGFDIYKATLPESGSWVVENMGVPVNSPADDFGIIFERKDEQGYFSSNRNDNRGYDNIYSFMLPAINILLKGKIYDINETMIPFATLRIVGNDGSILKTGTNKNSSFEVGLKPGISYILMASAANHLNQHFSFSTDPEETDQSYLLDFFLTPIGKPVVIDDIHYDFDQYTLRPESIKELEKLRKLMNDNPGIHLQIISHTDYFGTQNYNLRLSEKRAGSVVEWLIASGIHPERLVAKGEGKKSPRIITWKEVEIYNFLHPGDTLTEQYINTLTREQRIITNYLNRRTEFVAF